MLTALILLNLFVCSLAFILGFMDLQLEYWSISASAACGWFVAAIDRM